VLSITNLKKNEAKTTLAIDWSQVIEKPDKSFKVPGELLLQQRTKIETLQKEVENLKAAKSEGDQKASALNLRIETVLGDLESKNSKISEQEKTLEEQEKKIEELKEVIAGLEDNLSSSDEKQKELAKQVEELKADSKSKESQISDLTSKLSELEPLGAKSQEIEGKLTELESLQAKVTELEPIAAEKAQLEEQTKSQAEKIQNLESQLAEFQPKIEEITQKDDEIASLRVKIEELQGNLAAFAPKKTAAPEAKPKEGKGAGIRAQIPWKSKTGIHVCPSCSGNRTEEIQDKSKVLYIAAGTPIYAKKRRCLDCGEEWNVD